MRNLGLLLLLLASPACGQGQPMPIAKQPARSVARADNCAPIGRTANGELVYSMKCDHLPAPPPPPQARLEETAPPPPPPPAAPSNEGRTGLFGWSYDKRQPE